MSTNTPAIRSHRNNHRTYDPAAALGGIIDSLGSATPWAMLALCSMAPETSTRNRTAAARPAMRTVRDVRASASRPAAC